MGDNELNNPQVGAGGQWVECRTIFDPSPTKICTTMSLDQSAPKTTSTLPLTIEPPETQAGDPITTATHRETRAQATVAVVFPTTSTRISSSGAVVVTNAAATMTAVPSAGPSQSSSSEGVSKGAVAGIAVATAVLGAAIALLIAFLLFKKRKNRNQGSTPAYSKYDESTPELVSYHENDPAPYVQVASIPPQTRAATAMSSHLPSNYPDLDSIVAMLPPAADDATVALKLSGLFSQIHRHVETFYRDVHATITPSMEGELAKFDMGGSIGMVELLNDTSSPTVAIKHALVGYILSITSPDADEDSTLFPRGVVGVGENQMGSQDVSQVFALYKRLSVYLHTSSTSTTSRLSDIREAAEHFALTFFPWAHPGYNDQEKDADLAHIISSALETIIWVYGQPFTYEFMWDGVGRSGIVTSPRVVRVVGGGGGHGQVILENVVVAS